MIRTKLPLAFTGFIFLSLISWHCTKIDTTKIGSELIPAVDNVNTFETTISVIANNYDSILNNECGIVYPTDEHALGYIGNDPYFGTTKATLFTELKPAAFPFSFEAKPADRTLDSVVLVLSYVRTWGDSTIPQRVEVHEISKIFHPDTSTCSVYPFKPLVLGSATYTPKNLRDSVKAIRDTTVNQLRIKLSAQFGQSLLAQDSANPLNAFKSDSLFKEFFKGFAIVPDNVGNALNYFTITDTRTKLVVYYKYKRTNLSDTSGIANFSLYPGDQSANTITRTRTGAEVNSVANTNNPNGDNFVYIQTTPGTFSLLKIPGLTGLSNRIIHRAELIMEQATPVGVDNYLTAPFYLFLDLKDTSNFYHPFPCDFILSGGLPDIATYGGFKTPVTVSGNTVARYTFNISRYVQKLITNKKVMPVLRLWAPRYVITPKAYTGECNITTPALFFSLNNIAMGRVKLVGGSTAPNRVRLHIVYSNL